MASGRPLRTVEPVTRDEALDRLPEVHALALRLLDSGAAPDELPVLLSVEPEAVHPLLAVARAKLEHLMASPVAGDDRP
jgi:hypothetical protein